MSFLILFNLNLLAALQAKQCPESVIEIVEGSEWNEQDQASFDHAQVRCGEIYPQNPCVAKFTKVEELRYWVTCGAMK